MQSTTSSSPSARRRDRCGGGIVRLALALAGSLLLAACGSGASQPQAPARAAGAQGTPAALEREPPGEAITVYAAASLRDALPRIAPGQTYNFAGSDELQAQIERGAPADLFAAAAPREAWALFRAGLCTRPVTFATNVVVLLVPDGNPGAVESVASLRRGERRLAVGTPTVPIGEYTRALLGRMRLGSILRTNKVTLETSVSGITSKVALGAVDAGFVYRTDARTVADRTEVIPLPAWAQPPIRYRACVVRRDGVEAAAARRFLDLLTGRRARAVLQQLGFGLPRS